MPRTLLAPVPAPPARYREPLSIGPVRLATRFTLAPLAGYTNYPFRRTVRELGGAGLCTTDLVNARAVIEGSKKTRELLAKAELVDVAPMVKLASRFLALTAVRLASVRGARWEEIEDLDGEAPTWRVPAARMKMAAVKKLDTKNDHVVPLSRQAVALLRVARDMHHHRENMQHSDENMHGLIFADVAGRPIGEAAIGAMYKRAGFAGRHKPHGWRASFATILNERFPTEHVAIDRALAHSPKDKVAAAYDRSQQLAGRRRLFQAWADELDGAAA